MEAYASDRSCEALAGKLFQNHTELKALFGEVEKVRSPDIVWLSE